MTELLNGDMMYMYEGDTVSLRRLEPSDADIFFEYWNDYQLRKNFPNPFPRTLEDIQDFITSRNKSFAGRWVFTFGIEDTTNGALVGFIDLSNINWISRTAMIDNIVIFDKEKRGKGYGKEAMLLLLNFAFNIIGLHNVCLYVYRFNQHAIEFYKNFGFQIVGNLREAAYIDGKRDDTVIMDIIRSEFIDKYGHLPH
ncbi:MAG: GNAT family N-acetyltransferase [Candidatus Lokiarchaeota archaeon]|nr:GNAT family N-acetyltransferase [Candidatus Lokiarchaeota archaeon]